MGRKWYSPFISRTEWDPESCYVYLQVKDFENSIYTFYTRISILISLTVQSLKQDYVTFLNSTVA